ncbi:MAG: GtrA family protein [Syntrophobacteraceae bacterium]
MDNSKTLIQFFKFCAVGLLNSGIHYGVFLVLIRYPGMHYLAASAIGYCSGVLNSFVWNKHWTFRTRDARTDIEFAKFVTVNLASFLINLGSLSLFVNGLDISPEPGQALAISCALCVNFLGNKFWTFKSAHGAISN